MAIIRSASRAQQQTAAAKAAQARAVAAVAAYVRAVRALPATTAVRATPGRLPGIGGNYF